MADQTINIPRDSTMNALAKDTTLASILAQLTAQQAKLQAITQALIDRDIIGNNSITGIGDGTLTGAVVSLNNGKQKTLIAGDNIAIDSSTGRIDVTGMDVSYNDLDDVPEDIAFYGDETAGAVEEVDPPLYASDVVNDLVTGGVAVPLSAEQGKVLNQNLTELKYNVAGAQISLESYTTAVNKYTFLNDGYIYLNSGSATSSAIRVVVADATGTAFITKYIPLTSAVIRDALYVRKGMSVYCDNVPTGATVKFVPLIS